MERFCSSLLRSGRLSLARSYLYGQGAHLCRGFRVPGLLGWIMRCVLCYMRLLSSSVIQWLCRYMCGCIGTATVGQLATESRYHFPVQQKHPPSFPWCTQISLQTTSNVHAGSSPLPSERVEAVVVGVAEEMLAAASSLDDPSVQLAMDCLALAPDSQVVEDMGVGV